MKPRPESIQLSLKSALDLHIILPVRIEPVTLDLFVADIGPQYPWANTTIPPTLIEGNTTLGVDGVHTPFTNVSTWTSYVHDVVFQEETGLALKGSTNSYLGVLKSYVTMDKNIFSPSTFSRDRDVVGNPANGLQLSTPSTASTSPIPPFCSLPAQTGPT